VSTGTKGRDKAFCTFLAGNIGIVRIGGEAMAATRPAGWLLLRVSSDHKCDLIDRQWERQGGVTSSRAFLDDCRLHDGFERAKPPSKTQPMFALCEWQGVFATHHWRDLNLTSLLIHRHDLTNLTLVHSGSRKPGNVPPKYDSVRPTNVCRHDHKPLLPLLGLGQQLTSRDNNHLLRNSTTPLIAL